MDVRNMQCSESAVIGVALVDDHEVVLAGIQGWCQAADPPIAVRIACKHPDELADVGVPRVDVVVLDLQFDGSGPALQSIRKFAAAGHRVIVYSMVTEPGTILACLDLGALTYLAKSEGKGHLVAAIHAAVSDAPYVGPTMAGAMAGDKGNDRPTLSSREQEVLLQWFRTESKSLVGTALHLTMSTVNTHLGRVRTKYAAVGRPAPTKAALVARAVQDGLISIDEL